ncbi:hypothetical protein RB195_020203 [Necator americanus]|uniref:Uncharacterized protein n=1 Tax=Necator americanus TaxID=51031 RepID=A0ABR1CL96_NECAM
MTVPSSHCRSIAELRSPSGRSPGTFYAATFGGNRNAYPWLSCSSELNSLDYLVWSGVEVKRCGKTHRRIDESCSDEVSPEDLAKAGCALPVCQRG